MSHIHYFDKKGKSGKRSLAVLIDPDKSKNQNLALITELSNIYGVDYFFVGGSILMDEELDHTIQYIKRESNIPVILFPGNEMQIHPEADALLFLSLISGRNPEYLISKHVTVAPQIKKLGLPVIPTGYILMHGAMPSTTSYITNTQPIPIDKPDLAVATALAGELLGMQLIYLEGGSGTRDAITTQTIIRVRSEIELPILVGGGINGPKKLGENYRAGADIQVVGTAIEKNPELIQSFCKIRDKVNVEATQI